MDVGEPRSYEKATTATDAEAWLQAMRSEMESIHQKSNMGASRPTSWKEVVALQMGLQAKYKD